MRRYAEHARAEALRAFLEPPAADDEDATGNYVRYRRAAMWAALPVLRAEAEAALDAAHAAEVAPRHLAVLLAHHARLGAGSRLRALTEETVRAIADPVPTTPVGPSRWP